MPLHRSAAQQKEQQHTHLVCAALCKALQSSTPLQLEVNVHLNGLVASSDGPAQLLIGWDDTRKITFCAIGSVQPEGLETLSSMLALATDRSSACEAVVSWLRSLAARVVPLEALSFWPKERYRICLTGYGLSGFLAELCFAMTASSNVQCVTFGSGGYGCCVALAVAQPIGTTGSSGAVAVPAAPTGVGAHSSKVAEDTPMWAFCRPKDDHFIAKNVALLLARQAAFPMDLRWLLQHDVVPSSRLSAAALFRKEEVAARPSFVHVISVAKTSVQLLPMAEYWAFTRELTMHLQEQLAFCRAPDLQLSCPPLPAPRFTDMLERNIETGSFELRVHRTFGCLVCSVSDVVGLGLHCVEWQMDESFDEEEVKLVGTVQSREAYRQWSRPASPLTIRFQTMFGVVETEAVLQSAAADILKSAFSRVALMLAGDEPGVAITRLHQNQILRQVCILEHSVPGNFCPPAFTAASVHHLLSTLANGSLVPELEAWCGHFDHLQTRLHIPDKVEPGFICSPVILPAKDAFVSPVHSMPASFSSADGCIEHKIENAMEPIAAPMVDLELADHDSSISEQSYLDYELELLDDLDDNGLTTPLLSPFSAQPASPEHAVSGSIAFRMGSPSELRQAAHRVMHKLTDRWAQWLSKGEVPYLNQQCVAAINDIHEQVMRQRIIFVIGTKNAGKSTLLKVLWNVPTKAGLTEEATTARPQMWPLASDWYAADFPGLNDASVSPDLQRLASASGAAVVVCLHAASVNTTEGIAAVKQGMSIARCTNASLGAVPRDVTTPRNLFVLLTHADMVAMTPGGVTQLASLRKQLCESVSISESRIRSVFLGLPVFENLPRELCEGPLAHLRTQLVNADALDPDGIRTWISDELQAHGYHGHTVETVMQFRYAGLTADNDAEKAIVVPLPHISASPMVIVENQSLTQDTDAHVSDKYLVMWNALPMAEMYCIRLRERDIARPGRKYKLISWHLMSATACNSKAIGVEIMFYRTGRFVVQIAALNSMDDELIAHQLPKLRWSPKLACPATGNVDTTEAKGMVAAVTVPDSFRIESPLLDITSHNLVTLR